MKNQTKNTPNVLPEPKKVDISLALEIYSLDELKFEACENHLIGNFDKDKSYHILDIIYPELVNIHKVLEQRTSAFYTATASVEQTTLNFVVKFFCPEEGRISATLVLEEKLVIAGTLESTLSTPIKTITDFDTPDFPQKVRKAFHLYSKDEIDEKTLFEDYVSPPIELVTELVKKAELLEALESGREKLEADYINSVIKILKSTPEGKMVAKNFFAMVKKHGLHKMEEGRIHAFKEMLDFLLAPEIEKGLFSEVIIEKIATAQNTFSEETKKEAFNFLQTKAKSGFKGFVGAKKLTQNLETMVKESAPSSQSPKGASPKGLGAPPKPSPPSKPQGKDNKSPAKSPNINIRINIEKPLTSKPKLSKQKNNFEAKKDFGTPQVEKTENASPSVNPFAQKNSILKRAVQNPTQTYTQGENVTELYTSGIITATTETFGLDESVNIKVSFTRIETIQFENGLNL